MKGRLSIFVLLILCFLCSWGQKTPRLDPAAMDFSTNLVTPEVPERQAADIRRHMNSISEALKHLTFDTELRRNKEAVTVVIPCDDLFAPNSTKLKNSGKSRLQHLGKMLQYPTMYKVVVAVYSDDTGEPEYCQTLTSSRAQAIKDFFSDIAQYNNIHNPNVVSFGMGQASPRADNLYMDTRALNRRAEITILPEWEMIETARVGRLK